MQGVMDATEFLMIDFGDGTEMTPEVKKEEPTVILEPQVSQAQQFIMIDFDEAEKVQPKPLEQAPAPQQFITIDFDEVATTGMIHQEEGDPLRTQAQQFMTIDFGDGLDNQNSMDTSVTPKFMKKTEESSSKFMEFTFDEEPIMQPQEPAPRQAPPQFAYAPSPMPPTPPRNQSPANTVLFFVPGSEQGLLIYNQSPSGVEAKLTGYLPEGKFHTSAMEPVTFDPKKHSEELDFIRTPEGSYVQQVIMVEEKTFMKIALQGIYQQHPEDERRRHYFVVDMHDEGRDVRRELIQATYEEDKLSPAQSAIFDVMREVGKTDAGKQVIGELITGSNGKGQK